MSDHIVKIKNVDPAKAKNHVPVFITPTLDTIRAELVVGQRRFKTALKETGKKGEAPIYTAVAELVQGKDGIEEKPVPIELTEETQIPVMPGDEYNLSNWGDKLILDMLKASEFFIENEKDYNPISLQRVTIDDPMANARKTNIKADKVFEAMSFLRAQSQAGRVDIAFMLRQPASKMSTEQIEAKLNSLAQEDPSMILEIRDITDFEYQILLRRAAAAGLLTEKNGGWYNGSEVIGLDTPQAIAWMKQTTPQSESFVSSLIGRLRNVGMHSEGKLEATGAVPKLKGNGNAKGQSQPTAAKANTDDLP